MGPSGRHSLHVSAQGRRDEILPGGNGIKGGSRNFRNIVGFLQQWGTVRTEPLWKDLWRYCKQKTEKQNELGLGSKFTDKRYKTAEKNQSKILSKMCIMFFETKSWPMQSHKELTNLLNDLRTIHMLTRWSDSLPIASLLSMPKLLIVLHCFLLKPPIDYRKFWSLISRSGPRKFWWGMRF